jgi:ATP-dependent exoDNAse (exonuclease V) beta subunit
MGRTAIIDYKTGNFNPKHQEQLNNYKETVQKMGYDVAEKILVYIYPRIEIKIVQ